MASTAWSAICGHLSELTALPRDRWRWCGLIALSFSLSPVHSASLRPPIGHSVRDSDSHQRCQMEPVDSNLEICRWRITGRVLGFSTHKRRDYIEIPVLHDHMDHLYTHTHTHRHSRDIYTPTDTHTHTRARAVADKSSTPGTKIYKNTHENDIKNMIHNNWQQNKFHLSLSLFLSFFLSFSLSLYDCKNIPEKKIFQNQPTKIGSQRGERRRRR